VTLSDVQNLHNAVISLGDAEVNLLVTMVFNLNVQSPVAIHQVVQMLMLALASSNSAANMSLNSLLQIVWSLSSATN